MLHSVQIRPSVFIIQAQLYLIPVFPISSFMTGRTQALLYVKLLELKSVFLFFVVVGFLWGRYNNIIIQQLHVLPDVHRK